MYDYYASDSTKMLGVLEKLNVVEKPAVISEMAGTAYGHMESGAYWEATELVTKTLLNEFSGTFNSLEEVAGHAGGVYRSEIRLKDPDGEKYADVYYTESDSRYTQKYEAKSLTVKGTMPGPAADGDLTYIFFAYTGGLKAYEYTWVE